MVSLPCWRFSLRTKLIWIGSDKRSSFLKFLFVYIFCNKGGRLCLRSRFSGLSASGVWLCIYSFIRLMKQPFGQCLLHARPCAGCHYKEIGLQNHTVWWRGGHRAHGSNAWWIRVWGMAGAAAGERRPLKMAGQGHRWCRSAERVQRWEACVWSGCLGCGPGLGNWWYTHIYLPTPMGSKCKSLQMSHF